MSLKRTLVLAAVAWLALITALHSALNLRPGWFSRRDAARAETYRIGFLPVTCHLTCPVTDFIHHEMTGTGIYDPVRFNGWAELKEAFLSGYTPATFILAPMAMALREEGVGVLMFYVCLNFNQQEMSFAMPEHWM